MPPRHLYVHVPFCARRCSYCDFAITVGRDVPVEDFLVGLRAELEAGQRGVRPQLDTLYFGGGTPSRLGPAGVSRMLDLIRDFADIGTGSEITLEANPEDINPGALDSWSSAGVNRLSIGVQSFSDRALEWMHRAHTASDTRKALECVRNSAITNFSTDLIFSLPTEVERDWQSDLDEAISFNPPHVSLYGLTVEPGTPLEKWVARGESTEASEDTYAENFLLADRRLIAAGMEHYEVSNFALPGFRSRHNSAYWTGEAYAAAGPSAHRFDGEIRSWNRRGYGEWRSALADSMPVEEGHEVLTPNNRIAEAVYLGLRTDRGVAADAETANLATPWIANGWASLAGDRIRLTPEGWLRLDTLAADLTVLRSR